MQRTVIFLKQTLITKFQKPLTINQQYKLFVISKTSFTISRV